MRSTTKKILISQLAVLIVISLFGCVSPNEKTKELRKAYQKFRKEFTNADLTLDTSKLSQVATGDILKSGIASIEQKKRWFIQNIRVSSEAEIGNDFRVLEYKGDYSRIKTSVLVRNFTLDVETGERKYSPAKWFIVWVIMVKEDGLWKVTDIQSNDYLD